MTRLSFAKEPHIVVNEQAITAEEESLMYYSKDELTAIICECQKIVSGESKDECTRGLELLNTPDQRNRHKFIVWEVLREQRRQKVMGSLCAETLAKVAQEATAHRLKLAQARGKQDAQAAREGLWERIKSGTRRSSLFSNDEKECRRDSRRAARTLRRSGGGEAPRAI